MSTGTRTQQIHFHLLSDCVYVCRSVSYKNRKKNGGMVLISIERHGKAINVAITREKELIQ